MGNTQHKPFELCNRKLRVVKELGEGGFSFIYMVRDEKTRKVYAMKKINCAVEEQVANARWEMKVHRSIDHPNVMKLIDGDVVTSSAPKDNGARHALLLFPCYEGGSLQHHIELADEYGMAPYDEIETLRIFFEICMGLMALHRTSMAHRDIKVLDSPPSPSQHTLNGAHRTTPQPHNILLNWSEDGIVEPVLCDLGSAAPAVVTLANSGDRAMLQVQRVTVTRHSDVTVMPLALATDTH
jgi:serine/threonine kinase 16